MKPLKSKIKRRNNFIRKFLLTTLTIIWMGIIFFFSNQKAIASNNISDGIIDKIVIKTYSVFKNDVSTIEKEFIKKYFTRPIRKLGHFVVYFILGILVFFTLKSYNIKLSLTYYAILICCIYAFSDEFHQLFIPGRSCQISDVVLDTFSSSFSILLFNKK